MLPGAKLTLLNPQSPPPTTHQPPASSHPQDRPQPERVLNNVFSLPTSSTVKMPRMNSKDMLHTASPTPQLSDSSHPQHNSPLFATLPAEIRLKVYKFTLSSFDDPSKPFNPQHHHYRPGHEYRQKYDLRLLQTCKRIYHEARLLPVSLNEIVIYLYRGPRSNPPAHSQHDWRMRY